MNVGAGMRVHYSGSKGIKERTQHVEDQCRSHNVR
jgi:hypothetical protein